MVHSTQPSINSSGNDLTGTSQGTTGVAVVLGDGRYNAGLISLSCLLAKAGKQEVNFVYIIEVPRTQPLQAVLPKASLQADTVLNGAMAMARKIGCQAKATVLQVRSAKCAIVDEAREQHYSLLVLDLVYTRPHTLPKTRMKWFSTS